MGSERLGAIVQLLGDRSPRLRQSASEALGRLPPAALSRHADDFIRLLEDGDPAVRRVVAGALCRGPADIASQAGAVALCLADDDAAFRLLAVQALVRLDCPPAASVLASLGDQVMQVRHMAVEALGRVRAQELEDVAGAVVALLDSTDAEVCRAAATALGRLTPGAYEGLSGLLVARLEDADDGTRQAILVVLSSLEPAELAQHSASIGRCLHSSDGALRRTVVMTLGRLPSPAVAEHAAALIELLQDEAARLPVARVLGQLPPDVLKDHGPALATLLEHQDSRVRQTAVVVLGKVPAGVLVEHAEVIRQLFYDPDHGVRQAAVEALTVLDPVHLVHLSDELARCLSDGNGIVRRAAIVCIGRLPPQLLEEYSELISQRLEDVDQFVRCAAVEALAKLEPSSFVSFADAIVQRLDDGDEVIRRVAVDVLGCMDLTGLAWVVRALLRRLGDEDAEVQRRATDALGQMSALMLEEHAGFLSDFLSNLAESLNTGSGAHSAPEPPSLDESWPRRESMCLAVLQALRRLEPEVLAGHLDPITQCVALPSVSVRQEAIEALTNALADDLALCHEDATVRFSAVQALRAMPPEILTVHALAIGWLLGDPNTPVCEAALAALARLEPATLASQAAAVRCQLWHRNASVRRAAVAAVARLPDATGATEDLAAMLADEDGDVRRQAVEVLAQHADLGHYLNDILERLQDEESAVRLAVVLALGSLEVSVLSRHVEDIFALFADDSQVVRQAAAAVVRRLDPDVLTNHAHAVEEWLHNRDASIRCAALEAIAKIDPELQAGNWALIARTLDDEDASVRSAAISAISRMHPLLSCHADAFVRRLADEDEVVRRAASDAVAEILDGEAVTRDEVALAISKLDPDVLTGYASMVVRRLADSRVVVRQAAIMTLAKLSPEILSHYAGPLVTCLMDGNEAVRLAAAMALCKLEPVALTPHACDLAQWLDQGDADRQRITSAMLATTSTAVEQSAMVHRRVEAVFESVRRAAIVALACLEPMARAAHADVLCARLADPAAAVRRTAVEGLAGIAGEEAGEAGAAALVRHAAAVARRLGDEDEEVQEAALEAVRRLLRHRDEAVRLGTGIELLSLDVVFLAELAPDAAQLLADPSPTVCRAAEAVLRRLVDSGTSFERQAAVAELGSLPPAALCRLAPLLATCLEDDFSAVRVASISAFCHLELPDLAVYALPLARRLVDEDTGVWMSASEALGRLLEAHDVPEAQEAARTALCGLLANEGDVEREVAVRLFGSLRPSVLTQYASLVVSKLWDSSPAVRKAAVETIGLMEAAALAEHASEIMQHLDQGDLEADRAIGTILAELPPAALAENLGALIRWLHDPDAAIRRAAVIAFGKLEPFILAQHALIVALQLEDSDNNVRQAAVLTLCGLEPREMAKHARAIVHRTADHCGLVRRAAVVALGLMLQSSEQLARQAAVRELGKLLSDKDNVRIVILEVVKLEPAALEEVSAVVSEQMTDVNVNVRRAAINALARLSNDTLSLHAMDIGRRLRDRDSGVRQAAVVSLASLEPTEAREPFVQGFLDRLSDSNWMVRHAAAQALGQLPSSSPALTSGGCILAERLHDNDEVIREAALLALSGLEPTAIPLLHTHTGVQLLLDSHLGVRQAALVFLCCAQRSGNEAWQHAAAAALKTVGWLALVKSLSELPESHAETIGLIADLVETAGGDTLLHVTAKHGSPWLVSVLVKHCAGALRSANEAKETPLHLAAASGHLEICTVLVKAGALVCVRDMKQNTPEDLAVQNEHLAVAHFFESFRHYAETRSESSGVLLAALEDARAVTRIEWYTLRSEGFAGFSGTVRSLLAVSVWDGHETSYTYTLESVNAKSGRGLRVLHWLDVVLIIDEYPISVLDSRSIANSTGYPELCMRGLVDTAREAASCSSHDAALAVYNACAKPSAQILSLPDHLLPWSGWLLRSVGVDTGHSGRITPRGVCEKPATGGARDDTKSVSTSATSSDCHEPTPQSIHVTVGGGRGGRYDLDVHRVVNGHPLWKQAGGKNCICSGASDRWVISDEHVASRNFGSKLGAIRSSADHCGRKPCDIEEAWQWNSKASWQEDASIAVSSVSAIVAPAWLRIDIQGQSKGLYYRMPDEMANGFPLWKQQDGEMWMYSGIDGCWFISDDEALSASFDCEFGMVVNPSEHGGRMPHEMEGVWQWNDGEDWHDDPGITISEVARDQV